MCHQRNKFLKGWLVWVPRLQVLAAIGCECADKETRDAASREHKARRDQEREEDFLLENMPLIPLQCSCVLRARSVADEAQRIFQLFRRNGSHFQRLLRQATKTDSRLKISEEISGTSGLPAGIRG